MTLQETTSKRRRRDSEDMETPLIKKQKDIPSALDLLLPTSSITKELSEEDFRIITGTYERILYGINAYWKTSEAAASGFSLHLVPIFIVPAHTACIRTVAVGGNYLASGSADEIIRLYDVKRRKEYGSLGGHHQGDITDIKFFGKYMFSSSDDGTLCLWRTKDWEYLKTLKGHKGRIHSLAIHPTGRIALSVSSDKTAIVWNLMTARRASMTKLGRDEGQVVLWNKAGDQYAILFDRKIHTYSVSDAHIISKMEHRSKFLCMQYYLSPTTEKEYIVSGHEDKHIRVWDTSSGTCIAEWKGHDLRVKTVELLTSRPAPETVVTVLITTSSNGVIRCWDLEKTITDSTSEGVLLGEYDTKSRITCCTVHSGYSKAVIEEETTEK
ncbi:WD40-repeat-containing domain protein [Spinellus fusiger]|nr:WD40-repeat-containing domain protein [Spinellus fusiger]